MSKAKAVKKTIIRPVNISDEKISGGTGNKITKEVFPLTPQNYKLIAIGIVILAIGYLLLSLEKFKDATQFSIALYIAPFVIVAGYIEIIYAILYRRKKVDILPDSESRYNAVTIEESNV